MQEKTVVITGATSGIGKVAAEELAAQGARIVQVARNAARAEAALNRLRQIAPRDGNAPDHAVVLADLSVLSEMRRAAEEVARLAPRIDVLMNNAGAIFAQRELTEDGMERTFATNHLSYFVLTQLLREPLLAAARESGEARIVSTASTAHARQDLDFDDLQSAHGYGGFPAYCRSKLCNVLFTRELARRAEGTGVQVYCQHPGLVATRFGNQAGGWLQPIVRTALSLTGISEEEGARTMLYLASTPKVEGNSGDYFRQSAPKAPHPRGQNDANARRLWTESVKLTGLDAW